VVSAQIFFSNDNVITMADPNTDFTLMADASSKLTDFVAEIDRIGYKTIVCGVLLGLFIIGYFVTCWLLYVFVDPTIEANQTLFGMGVGIVTLMWLAILLNTGFLYESALKEKNYRQSIYAKLQLMGSSASIQDDGSRPCAVNYRYDSKTNACSMIHSASQAVSAPVAI
jgi:hypothetical protein